MSFKSYCLALGVIALSGCSSIIEGNSQEILINTNPNGASCTLERNSLPIGTVSPTPSAIVIKKTKYDIIVRCNLEGYQEATYFNKSGSAGATFGNLILGGGIGWAIDSASGSDNKYDSPVNITLVPNLPYAASTPPTKAAVPAQAVMPAAAQSVTSPAVSEKTTEPKEESDYPKGKNG